MERRTFLQLSTLASGGLWLGAGCTSGQVRHMHAEADDKGRFVPNAYLSITPDDRVLLAMNKAEMGQGIMTAHALLVAEELEVGVERIEPFHVFKEEFETSFGEANINMDGVFGAQVTGGSSSISEGYIPIREMAASAREMLRNAAAASWGVEPNTCQLADGKVAHGPSGRSARYGELAKLAAQQSIVDGTLKQRDFRVLGKASPRRTDIRGKVDGSAIFGTDVAPKNLLCATVLHPPVLGAEVTSSDFSKAESMRGVVAVFAFERGVAIVAERYWQAIRAAKAVNVEWGPGDLKGLSTRELARAATDRVRTETPTHTLRSDGDVADAADEDGATVVKADYAVPYLAHATMEPQNCTALVTEERVKLWVPTQSPTIAKEAAASYLGLHRDDVEVELPMIGGGFGRRLVPDIVVETLAIARRLPGRPVKLIWSRESDMRQAYYRPLAAVHLRGVLDAKKEPVGLYYHAASQPLLADQGTFLGATVPDWFPLVLKRLSVRVNTGVLSSGSFPDILSGEGAAGTPYAMENIDVGYTPIRTNVPIGFWRSVAHSYNGFVMEGFIDEMAHAAGADPIAFRRKLLQGEPRYLALLDKVAAMSPWGASPRPGFALGVAIHRAFGSICAQVVEAGVVDGQIRVPRVWCAFDCGFAIHPDGVRAQIEGSIIFALSAALHQAIEIEDGVVKQGNFDDFPMVRMHDAPRVAIALLRSEEEITGVGEPAVPPLAPAVANALFRATGVRLRTMPFQPAWDALARQTKGGTP